MGDMNPSSTRHDGFISYRHVNRDRKWAKWLHKGLVATGKLKRFAFIHMPSVNVIRIHDPS
jgi:hypothetical protein